MGIGMSELLIILVIVVLVFGTKRLKSVGGDLGEAISSFRNAMKDGGEKQTPKATDDEVIEGEVTHKDSHNNQA
jgi:sec-independent protein translocase protein TatA